MENDFKLFDNQPNSGLACCQKQSHDFLRQPKKGKKKSLIVTIETTDITSGASCLPRTWLDATSCARHYPSSQPWGLTSSHPTLCPGLSSALQLPPPSFIPPFPPSRAFFFFCLKRKTKLQQQGTCKRSRIGSTIRGSTPVPLASL